MLTRHVLTRLALFGAGCVLATAPFVEPLHALPAASERPKNVIVLIGDGMGYNHIASASLYEHGVAYKQVTGTPGAVREVRGTAAYAFEDFPVQLDVSTFWSEGSYDPARAWTDFDYVRKNPTDSAAAATAMATGHKTYKGGIGVDAEGREVQNVSERALSLGKAAGVVSSVQFSHATPASWTAHDADRDHYLAIAHDQVTSDLTVVMGAGHPFHNRNGTPRETPRYRYISEDDFTALASGSTGFELVESRADFESLATGATPKRVFGIAQVSKTLQQARSGASPAPHDAPFTERVPALETMTRGALNVLDNDPDGFSLMVEGGAIDWAGAANQRARAIEETMEFTKAVDAVVSWVETNSSWDETLVIVTADHETGYLGGVEADPAWTPLAGGAGKVPSGAWQSGSHTNQLVPLYANGAGAGTLRTLATGDDPVRGDYLDNTDLGRLVLEKLWPARR